ncbi:unnamed protein product [Arctia plantaginis]|uniref:Major facilitator superfamily (MFS) profile domain-containing protein n=1 Tax=Arctia plantaginis TaxID=874455 RepID=A0A8S0YT77_ARCPL|nr:unnamed protein product [Arctia plantaginis]
MQTESNNLKSKGHTRVQWAVAVSVNTAAMTFGLQCGWMSPVSKILQSENSPIGRPLTDSELSLIAAIPALTATFGILASLYIVDAYGRKKGILFTTVAQLVCWIITICSRNYYSLMVARVFCGFGGGATFHVIPMYVKEISQDNIRGTLGTLVTMLQNIGILAMYALGGYLDYYSVLYLVTVLPVLTILIVYVVPESPSFSVKQGKLEEAAKTIAFLRGVEVNDKEVECELNLIKKEREHFESMPKITFLTMFKDKAMRRGFIIMVIIFSVLALNGTFSIINFAVILLADSEMKISPEAQALSIPTCLILGTSITMYAVDKFGRKVLLGVTLGMSSAAFASLASSMILHKYGWATPDWLPIAVILVIVCCYGTGVSTVPYVLITEMFSFQIRAMVMACICILAWHLSFVQLVSFTAISSAMGVYTSFYIFSANNLFGLIVVVVILPETRGKSVEQIELKLRGK